MKFGLIRDTAATLISLGSAGTGFIGMGLKKFAVSADDSLTKKFVLGVVSLVGGPGSLLAYLVAKPGQETKAELARARADVVNGRY